MDNPNVAEVVAFLLGEAPLEGRWFGDEENLPTVAGRPARYWWRSRLRAALEAQGEAVAEVYAGAFGIHYIGCADPNKLPVGTKLYTSAPGGEVTDAAYRWWLSRRPLAFNEAEHLANPGINTCSDAEKALAKAVAAARAALQASAPGGEVTDDPVEERFMDSLLDWLWKEGHGDESPQYQAAIALMLDRRQHIAALSAQASVPGGEVTEEMVRKALHYCPKGLGSGPKSWRWMANHINAALAARTGKGESDGR